MEIGGTKKMTEFDYGVVVCPSCDEGVIPEEMELIWQTRQYRCTKCGKPHTLREYYGKTKEFWDEYRAYAERYRKERMEDIERERKRLEKQED